MKHLRNERGNGMVYMLWIMVMSIAICVIVLNFAKVYAVKQQAATATQQAALAGTSVLVNAAKEGFISFDMLIDDEDVVKQLLDDGGKSIEDLVDEKAQEYRYQGLPKDIAYINAMNDILTPRMETHGSLKSLVNDQVILANGDFKQTVREVVKKNGGNEERIEVVFTSDFRVEVKADVTYESITDSAEKYIEKITKEVPQKGYGPSLLFLRGVSTDP
ncbi:MAG TPA: hypothetical protein VFX34_07165 [Sporosarcina sp.]|nr:hypothetical protein [Sporosarcina sp.]